MTIDSPKEREARPLCNCAPCQREAAARNAPIPYLRRQVAELVFDALDESQRGRGVLPIHTNSDVDAAAAAVVALVQPELERLTAEVALYRERDGLTRQALQFEDTAPLQFAALIVRQQRDKAVAEVSRLREQLAAQPTLPSDAETQIARAIHSYWDLMHGASGEDYDETAAGQAHQVMKVLRSWGASSSEEEAPQPQEMAQHKVRITKLLGSGQSVAVCPGCRAGMTGADQEAKDWKDQHEADILRPVSAWDLLGIAQEKTDEGRPSGSERLAPQDGVGPSEPPAYVVALAQPPGSYWRYLIRGTKRGWYFSNSLTPEAPVVEGGGWGWAYSRAELPLRPVTQVRDVHGDVWTHVPGTFEWSSPETQNCAWAYMVRKWAPLTAVVPAEPQDAAQAARSEATPHPDQELLLAKLAELQARRPVQYATEEDAAPSPSLRKEGEDRPSPSVSTQEETKGETDGDVR